MIDLTTSLTPTTGSASASAVQPAAPGAAASVPGGFVLALGAYLDASAAPPGTQEPAVGARQDDADDGKIVPQDASDSKDDADPDTALMWFPGLMVPGLASAIPASSGVGAQGGNVPALGQSPNAVKLLGGTPGSVPALAGLSKGGPATVPVAALDVPPPPTDTATLVQPTPVTILSSGSPTVTYADAAPPPPVDTGDARLQPPATAPVVALAARASQPTSPIQPARQAFATALGAMLVAPKRSRTERDDSVAAPFLTTDTAQLANGDAIKSTGDAQQAQLDLRQDRGIGQMIDHIEALRDDANTNDTRIRLVPNALGTIDVAVRKDGDAVHVHFTAQNDATRAAIADAQPRLTEMAETRGVRIAGTSIDSGNGSGGSASPQPRPEPIRPGPVPATSRREDVADTDSNTSQRLA